MAHELIVVRDAAAAALAAAERIATEATAAVAARGVFSLAFSGGRSPWVMFEDLAGMDLPWESVELFQVDERVAPDDDPIRNLTHLHECLGPTIPVAIHPLPVTEPDLDAAAAAYAGDLPAMLDVIHLGLGADGHTASLVPGDAVLHVDDRLVAPTAGPYQDTRRLTLTYPGLQRGRLLLWLVTGADKRAPLRQLLAGDPAIPAGRVTPAGASVIIADEEAAG